MQQPTDSSQNPAMEGYECELVKSLYGRRQAGEIWASHLNKTLINWGFTVSKLDSRLYFYNRVQEFLTLAIAVDDRDFASITPKLMHEFKSQLAVTFSVQLFGKLSSFIGWTINLSDQLTNIY